MFREIVRSRSGNKLASAVVLAATLSLAGCREESLTFPKPQPEVVASLREGGDASASAETSGEQPSETGTGWGSIRGTFVLDGDPPPRKLLATGGKDAPTCNPNGIPDESLVVDADTKGVKNIVIYARKVSRVHEELAAKQSEAVDFDQKNCMFLSHVKPVLVSQPVILKNSEASVGHNTSISPPADKSTNPLLPPGAQDEYKFSRPQNVPVPVSCSIHPWMKAYILPRENPYFAVSDDKGHFVIDKVPAGEEVEFQLWQEVAGGPQNALVIAGVTDNRGRIVKKLEDGQTLDLGEIKIPLSAFKL
jgi:hypothetical protein